MGTRIADYGTWFMRAAAYSPAELMAFPRIGPPTIFAGGSPVARRAMRRGMRLPGGVPVPGIRSASLFGRVDRRHCSAMTAAGTAANYVVLLLLSLPSVAGKARPELPQSTVLALAQGELKVSSEKHPNSYLLRVWSEGEKRGICLPVEGLDCCRSGAWYLATSSEIPFGSTGGFYDDRARAITNPASWARADALIPGPGLSYPVGERRHQPKSQLLWATPSNDFCFAELVDDHLVPYAHGSAAPTDWPTDGSVPDACAKPIPALPSPTSPDCSWFRTQRPQKQKRCRRRSPVTQTHAHACRTPRS